MIDPTLLCWIRHLRQRMVTAYKAAIQKAKYNKPYVNKTKMCAMGLSQLRGSKWCVVLD